MHFVGFNETTGFYCGLNYYSKKPLKRCFAFYYTHFLKYEKNGTKLADVIRSAIKYQKCEWDSYLPLEKYT